MARRKPRIDYGGKDYDPRVGGPIHKPKRKPAKNVTARGEPVTTTYTPPTDRVHAVGYWEDGTPKLAAGDGTVLPKGTTWTVGGQGVVILSPTGQPIEYQRDNGTVERPVQNLTDLPSGSYDPGLLYQSQNANLGQLYGQQDYTTSWGGQIDPATGKIATDANGNPIDGYKLDANGQIMRPTDLSSAPRGLADYFTNLDRINQDYSTATNDLSHQYGVLANNQLQSINAAGELSGGALAQALAKRTANQAHDQAGIDTTHNRSLTDLLTGTTRSHADATTTLGRSTESNALYQGGLSGTATYQANQSGQLVDNPNYETHNGVLYSIAANGTATPVKKITENKPASYTMPKPNPNKGSSYNLANQGSSYSMKPKKKKGSTGSGGTLAP